MGARADLVVDSSEQLEFSGEFPPGVTFTVKMSAPPQANPERLYRLACFHIQAIFFLIIFNSVNQCGGFIPGIFKPLMAVNRSDWGNVVMRAFTSQLQSWNPRFAGIAAREFFKATVRRHPEGKQVWAWALEMEPELSRYRVLGKRENVKWREKSLHYLCSKRKKSQKEILSTAYDPKFRCHLKKQTCFLPCSCLIFG